MDSAWAGWAGRGVTEARGKNATATAATKVGSRLVQTDLRDSLDEGADDDEDGDADGRAGREAVQVGRKTGTELKCHR